MLNEWIITGAGYENNPWKYKLNEKKSGEIDFLKLDCP